MSAPHEMAERHGRILAELGELALTLARDLQGRALAAETPQEAAALADAFHRIARSVRQSVALEAKVARDARREARALAEDAVREKAERIETRKAAVQKALQKVIALETDCDFADMLYPEIPEIVRLEAESESFLDGTVEEQIARLRRELGIDTACELAADEDWEADDPADPEAETPPGRTDDRPLPDPLDEPLRRSSG